MQYLFVTFCKFTVLGSLNLRMGPIEMRMKVIGRKWVIVRVVKRRYNHFVNFTFDIRSPRLDPKFMLTL